MKARALTLIAWTLLACDGEGRSSVALPSSDECSQRRDGVICSDGVALTCASGRVAMRDDCGAKDLVCAVGAGCRVCDPFDISCDEAARYRCAADGNTRVYLETCAGDLKCSAAGCVDLCAEAARERSYLGCDYYPTFTHNNELASAFHPAVAIGNGNLVTAHVVIEKNGLTVDERDVPPRSSLTVELAFEDALQRATGSSIVRQGAYHLVSDVPVTVHQFNPLLFEVPRDCPDEEPEGVSEVDGKCNSYTNDASLLFPSTALAPDVDEGETEIVYLAASRATATYRLPDGSMRGVPGFLAIVAVGNQPAQVTVRVSAHTLASPPVSGGEPIEALAPGGVLARTLAPGDVLQLLSAPPETCTGATAGVLCDPGPLYDLTGTEVRADAAIQVIGGHDCTYVPFDTVACDHLEESIPPLRTWDTRTIASRPHTDQTTAHVLRVVSGGDRNEISFDPPIRAPVTLARGEFVELRAAQPVMVRGRDRLLVVQYLVGQGATGLRYVGDPSMSIGVPVAQFRTSYNFLTPSTYSINYIDVIAPTGSLVTLDGKLLSGFTPVGNSGYGVTFVVVTTPGAHELRGSNGLGLGVVLYGLAPYTSYMLPGGLDLTPVDVIVI